MYCTYTEEVEFEGQSDTVLQDWTVQCLLLVLYEEHVSTVLRSTESVHSTTRTEGESRLSCKHSDAGGRGACRDDSRETRR